jgi:DNA-binding beta-propeller fold protein YncE
VLGAAISATAPKAAAAVVVAATEPATVGAPADPADLAASRNGATTAVPNAAGDRLEVRLPLRDVSGDTVGALRLSYTYRAGADRTALERNAEGIRDRLHRRISHAGNLFDPYPYEPGAPSNTYAQQLVDEFIDRYPDIEVLAIHVTPPDSDYNIIAGSNIGRLGKKADNDDMRCVFTGKPNLEVNSTGKRFESELQLHDRAGNVIGAVGIVVAYKNGDDKRALHARAEKVAAELEKRIPDSASLFGPAKTVATNAVAASAVARSTGAASPAASGASSDSVLVLQGRTELPGYSGDFDHFAVDLQGNRLFLAAEDHGTLEVFDLHTGKHLRSVKGFETPHSIFPIPQTHRLLITDGSESIKLLDAETLASVGTIKLHPGADSIGFDNSTGHLYVVTGGKDVKLKESWLEEIDPVTTHKLGEVHLDADHVEAMAVEQHGPHLYINVTDKNYLAVIDKAARRIVARWPIDGAAQNALAQLDEATHRLFIVARDPGRFIVLNSDTGAQIARLAAPKRVDAEIFDVANRRVYAPGGEGYIGVYAEVDAGHFAELARVPSSVGAKTAILVPELHRLYVAVSPGEGKTGGGIIWFDVKAVPAS